MAEVAGATRSPKAWGRCGSFSAADGTVEWGEALGATLCGAWGDGEEGRVWKEEQALIILMYLWFW